MTEQSERNSQKVVDALLKSARYGIDNECVINLLEELVNQFGYTHLYLDGDHGIGVVNVKDIQQVIQQIRK